MTFTADKSRKELVQLLAQRYGYKPSTFDNYVSTNQFFSTNVYDLIKDLKRLDKMVKKRRENYYAMHPSKKPGFQRDPNFKPTPTPAPPSINYEIEIDENGIPVSLEDKKQMVRRLFDKMNKETPELIEEYGPFERTKSVFMSVFCAMHKIPQSRMHSYIYTHKLFEGHAIAELIFMPEYVIKQIQEFEAIRIKEANKLQEQRTDKEINSIFQDGAYTIPGVTTKKEDSAIKPLAPLDSISPESSQIEGASTDSESLSSLINKIDSEISKKQQEILTLEKVKSYIETLGVK